MARQFIYHMRGLTKAYPGNQKVLENIHLSFYPDAKIGVLGVNGSGKSTLLRIMAGIDKDFTGEGWVAEGARVGYLPQEPQLDPAKNVRENVMEGVAPQQAILDRYNELAMNYSDETADEMTPLQDEIEAKDLWDLDCKVEQAMDALGCPPDDWPVDNLSGGERRRVALCKLLLEQPELLLLDEPTNHLDAETVAWLEGHLRSYPGAILIVTHDRYFLDNVTGWILELDRGRGIPYEGNYSAWLEQKQKRLAQEGREDEARQRTIEREQRMDAAVAEGPAGQVEGPHPALRGARRQGRTRRGRRTAQIVIPIAERLGQNVIDVRGPQEGLRRQAPHRRPLLQAAARRHRRRHRPERRRQDDAVPHDHRPGEAGRRRRSASARRVQARLCRPVAATRSTPTRRVWEEISGGNEILYLGKREINARAYCSALQLQGRRPAEEGRRALRRRAQPRPPRQDPEDAAPTSCSSTSRPTTSTSRRCARSKRRSRTSPAAPSSSATTACSSTASPPTSSPSRATATSSGSRAISTTTRRTRSAGSGRDSNHPAPDQVQEVLADSLLKSVQRT